VKIRSGLSVKHKKGDFVAAFAPYGYKRDENDKHKLVIDAIAAETVRDIFRRKIEGMSQQKIADRLNDIGEPSPAEFKKRNTGYVAQFQTNARALWSAVAVGRILRNPIYTGVLIQGKQTTPSYKVKKRFIKPVDEWHVAADVHEAIVSQADYDAVNMILNQDTRTSPLRDMVYPLSGLVFCADCGNNMVRTKSDKTYYYVCASSRGKNKSCTSHCIQQGKLGDAVMEAIACQIAAALNIEKSLTFVRSLPTQIGDVSKLNGQIGDREKEIKLCEGYKRSLYEDYKNGIISKDDYVEFGADYTEKISALKQSVGKLKKEVELLFSDETSALHWLKHFTQYKNIPEFSRPLAVKLISRIEVFDKKRIVIRFRYQDQLDAANEVLQSVNQIG
jgi:hypothetical protein